MSAFATLRSQSTTFAALALFALALPGFSQSGPKNLVSPTYRAPAAAPAPLPQGLTKKEAARLAATAASREDHLKLAGYYRAESDRLDAQAAGYEEAAAAYGRGPNVKNLMAPTAVGRYEFLAKDLREEAKSNRLLAARHESMPN